MTPSLALLFPVVRGLIDGVLLLLIGGVAAQRIATPLLPGTDRTTAVRAQLWLLILPRLLATFLLALCLARSALQLLSFMTPGDTVDPDFARAVLTGGTWGTANLMQSVTTLLLFCACTLLRTRPRQLTLAVTVALPLLLWSQSGMGHGTEERWPLLAGRLVHTTHLLGAGLWLGTLAVLALAVLPALRAGQHTVALAKVIGAFSRYARVGAVLVAGSGLVALFRYGVSMDAFIASTWGRLLLVKLCCFSGVLALGWWNWKVMTPALLREHPGTAARLRRAIHAELVLGLAMLIITALLVGSPLPALQP